MLSRALRQPALPKVEARVCQATFNGKSDQRFFPFANFKPKLKTLFEIVKASSLHFCRACHTFYNNNKRRRRLIQLFSDVAKDEEESINPPPGQEGRTFLYDLAQKQWILQRNRVNIVSSCCFNLSWPETHYTHLKGCKLQSDLSK